MHILYLEDNPLDANLTQFSLNRAFDNLQLDIYHRLSDALGKLEQSPAPHYDLVLTDLNLPDGSGLDLLSHIRSQGLPYAVIVVTGQMDEGTILSALKAGANDYIIKREDYLERLPATIENTLQRYTAEAQMQQRPIKVLYADNNSRDVEQTIAYLRTNAAHIQLETVRTSRELYRAVSHDPQPCDVILLDYYFAGLTGVEILKELEALHNKVPVVIVTGQGSEDIVLQVTRLGAADYISKEPGYLFRLPLVLENAYHRWRFAQGQVALRSAEVKYRALVEQIPAAVYVALPDDEATTIFISPQIEEICGYTPEEWLNDSALWLKLIHPEDRERVRELHLHTNATGEPFVTEYRFVTKDGGIVWIRDQSVFIPGANGEPGTWQGFFQDITSKITSELALKRQVKELSILHTIAKLSTVSTSIDDIIERATQAIGDAFTFDNFGVLLYDAKQGVLRHHPSYREHPAVKKGVTHALGEGITGTVARTGVPWLISDVRTVPEYIPTSPTVMSELCVPIRSGEKLIGVLNAESDQVNFFTDDDLRLMVTVAGQLAAVIERNRLFEEERKRRQEAETLRQATAVISSSLELEDVLNSMLASIKQAVQYDSAAIFLSEPDGSLLVVSETGFDGKIIPKRIEHEGELFATIRA
ncbi:MAG: response regulator, partial [Anaerolineales bacterium]